MKIKSKNLSVAAGGLIITVLLLSILAITGCDEAGMVKPVVPVDGGTEPVEPSEPTTNGDVKKPEEPSEPVKPTEPTEPEPTEPVEPTEPEPTEPSEPAEPEPTPEPEPEPEYITLDLPPGYSIPLEFTPTKETVLSRTEQSLAIAQKSVGWDAITPQEYTTNSPADAISLLPHKDREEVYALFVTSVDLPFFAEAAEKMKDININLIVLSAEAAQSGDWDAYDLYKEQAEEERGFQGLLALDYLVDIYFEENPEKEHLKGTGHSMYWLILEWYRLRLENPDLSKSILYSKIAHPIPLPNIQKLLELFQQSVKEGNILGLDNPWS